jgi:hypothetical protein
MFNITKYIIINSRVRKVEYDGFIKTEGWLLSTGRTVLLPFVVHGKRIGFTRWI